MDDVRGVRELEGRTACMALATLSGPRCGARGVLAVERFAWLAREVAPPPDTLANVAWS